MRQKYPRTFHVPFSPGATNDDKVLASLAHFEGRRVVVTEKMDGECTTLYTDGFHARSLDSRHHPSRDWLARFHAEMGFNIPEGWRVCGENLYARHSLGYSALPSYFMGFSVWDERNRALNWADTQEMFELLGVTSVPVLFRGEFDEVQLRRLVAQLDLSKQEGFVVRLEDGFGYDEFSCSLAKWVRPAHVQTGEHWMHASVVPNGLQEAQ